MFPLFPPPYQHSFKMNTDRTCGCKSFRSCFICEKQFNLFNTDTAKDKIKQFPIVYNFNNELKRLVAENVQDSKNVIEFPGIIIIEDFVTSQEEADLVRDLDLLPWDTSQSGRRKQNFGPRANFKKRKVKVGKFAGFPRCTTFIKDRFNNVPCLQDYKPVEQCSIEYRPETGSCIELHIDDCWIWGERIVQLNLLADSTLTLVPLQGNENKYNLSDLQSFPRLMDENGQIEFNPFREATKENINKPYSPKPKDQILNGSVRIPLPRRSLFIMFGEPRYDWEHCILREDIKERRIVIAYRELTPPYLPGGNHQDVGLEILDQADKVLD